MPLAAYSLPDPARSLAPLVSLPRARGFGIPELRSVSVRGIGVVSSPAVRDSLSSAVDFNVSCDAYRLVVPIVTQAWGLSSESRPMEEVPVVPMMGGSGSISVSSAMPFVSRSTAAFSWIFTPASG
ncbi:MAG: hypothetical protein KVP17_002053 [Porospora cf. gigantea B]|uniref:uncharacterized protein n=1 Tax=Porospora cf. gigantea B TaxID=2853592 RepID=UPI003571A76F|nr:MAG: hypothetical protein KVP17_002053 [Porospora cf. gigantea B]